MQLWTVSAKMEPECKQFSVQPFKKHDDFLCSVLYRHSITDSSPNTIIKYIFSLFCAAKCIHIDRFVSNTLSLEGLHIPIFPYMYDTSLYLCSMSKAKPTWVKQI